VNAAEDPLAVDLYGPWDETLMTFNPDELSKLPKAV
jgi:hypothetical protein